MQRLKKMIVIFVGTLILSLNVLANNNKPVFSVSTIEDATNTRAWLVTQSYQDGISFEEAKLVGFMYWRSHRHEYRFIAGALGDPEDQEEYWYLPYHQGAGADRSNHGVLIDKITGKVSHPKLKVDIAYMLLQKEIDVLELFIANKLLEVDANKARLN